MRPAFFEKFLQKKIASTSYTWLPFNYCQTIRCGLFISFNAVDLMWYNSGSSWSCSHIQHRVLFSPSSSFFYSPERIKSTSAFKEQLFSVPHPKTSRLPQWITSDFASLLWQQKMSLFTFFKGILTAPFFTLILFVQILFYSQRRSEIVLYAGDIQYQS